MEIVIINGSHRKNGATALILNELCRVLKKRPKVQIQYIHVSDLYLKYCIGCGKCYQRGTCIFKDDIEHLSLEIAKADGVILGSPTYAGNVSAQMKTIIDRGHFVIEQLLYKKYAVSVATYENYGGNETVKIMNHLLARSGAQISGSILAKVAFSSDPLENSKIKKTIHQVAATFYNDMDQRRIYFYQTLRNFLIFKIGIVPFVKRKGKDYAGVLQYWNKKNQDNGKKQE